MPLDINSLADGVTRAIEGYVVRSFDVLTKRLDVITLRLDALPRPRDGEPGRDAEVDYDRVSEEIARQVALIPRPTDGKSVDPETVRALAELEVAIAVKALPPPRDGKDAEPIAPEVVDELVERHVVRAIAALPPPRDGADGKDAEPVAPELVEGLVRESVSRAIAALPPPLNGVDGKDAEPISPEVVDRLVKTHVASAIATLPPPRDPISFEVVDELVERHVARAVAKLPPPRDGVDGKDAEPVAPELVERLVGEHVARSIAALPPPVDGADGADGKDAEPVDYAHIDGTIAVAVRSMVAEAVRALPAPKDGADGKDVNPEAVREIVAAEVTRAVAALPTPRDGKDGQDVDPATVREIRERVEGALASAARALGIAETAAGEVDALIALPKSPGSFFIDDAGELIAVYSDGATKVVGAVRGKDGTRGASIMDGHVDDAGQLVLRMSDGRIINAGAVRGAPGKDGVGLPGKRGRDALEAHILPGIDETRSYPQGACAIYRGGLILAERATDPIVDGDLVKAGWRAALEGIAEETERVLDGGRVIVRTTTYTDGRVFERSHKTAVMIWRGVWTEQPYEPGDAATWNGSVWHCEQPTTERPGSGSLAWKLATKCGSPGKDGKSVKGEPGKAGKDGRDLTQLGFDGGKH